MVSFINKKFTSLVSSLPVCIIFRQKRRHLVNIIIRVVPNLVLDVCTGEMDNIHTRDPPLCLLNNTSQYIWNYKAFSVK